ncbi:hypothetical protein DSECCO2_512280 [anaerobic digester metagenome]
MLGWKMTPRNSQGLFKIYQGFFIICQMNKKLSFVLIQASYLRMFSSDGFCKNSLRTVIKSE